tara:strand:- start:1284 stop:1487 length:204 start_codon:yes stop_codon:yes gene_type:complete
MNEWCDRTNLKKQIISDRKKFYLDQIMSGDLSPEETEEVIQKVVKCNEILFNLSVQDSKASIELSTT